MENVPGTAGDSPGQAQVAIRELLGFPLRYLAELPGPPTTLTLDVHGHPSAPALPVVLPTVLRLVLTSDRERYAAMTAEPLHAGHAHTDASAAAKPIPVAVLSPLEYEHLAVVLAERPYHAARVEVLEALRRKAAQPTGRRLTAMGLLGAVRRPDGGGERWTVGQLCEALGARLVAVEAGGERWTADGVGEGASGAQAGAEGHGAVTNTEAA